MGQAQAGAQLKSDISQLFQVLVASLTLENEHNQISDN